MAYGRPNMGGMNQKQMMKQAQKLQEQMMAAQAKLMETEFSASTGGGAVKVTVTGDLRVKSLSIDPDAFVSQAKVKGVYGEGFDHVKLNLKQQEVDEITSNAASGPTQSYVKENSNTAENKTN